ncbi:helix-turn-helix domain-containing protein [uncultured Chryseobacterium sp.]|uniref:helix-turn-helix domain-containing protein n=1 Tax=uncultured Chryseobacterium sp. TaxID=259322 RepID=UPI002583EED1|nr:helix-turn-helix domain-containing protein [uncultured Chryseobacterium sp.]
MNKLDIKEFRRKYNLSQEDLAEITGVQLRTVKAWEYGERNISKIAEKTIHNYTLRGVAKEIMVGKTDSKTIENIKNKPHDEQMGMLYERIGFLENLIEKKDKENEERIRMLVDVIAKERNAIIDVLVKSMKEQKKESM